MNTPDNSIVRILDTNGVPVGGGFLATATLVMTCAHVVQVASDSTEVGGSLLLDFPLVAIEKKLSGRIIFLDYDNDIACLNITDSLPSGAHSVKLVIADNLWGHTFRTFGFPRNYLNGVWSSGVLRGNTGAGWLQIEDVKDPGFNVQRGFSGGLVWDDQLQAVVGMIVAAEMDRTIKAAFCIPVRGLINTYPLLKEHSTVLCPYRSLDIFTENEKDFFFGRNRLISKLMGSLKRELRFLAIVGPSGTGKSSLVRAGLFSALKEGKVPSSERWQIMTIRPAAQPFAQLENVGLINIYEGMEASVRSWLTNNPDKTRLVLFIDQFEELLIITPRDIRKHFVAEMLRLLNSSLSITIILTLRSDFTNRFFEEAAVLAADWLQLGLVSIPPFLEMDELYEMIVNPAAKIGVKFEQGLVDRIIKDAIDIDKTKEQAESTILPLLEFALTQMWSVKEGNSLSHNDYQKIGGVAGGLALWADKAFYDLEDNERRNARRILTDLINFGDEVLHIPHTKRIRKYELIARNEAAQGVIQKMVNARLLIAGYDMSFKQNTVEIIHEALIYRWALLLKWIEEDREYLQIYYHFAESAKDWKRLGKEDGLLYRGTRLSVLVHALENRKEEILSDLEIEFLEASKQYEKLLDQILSARREIASNIDLSRIFETTMLLINESIGAEQGTLLIFVPEQNKLQYQAGYNFLAKDLYGREDDVTFKDGEDLVGWAFKQHEIVIIGDLQSETRWMQVSPSSVVFRSAMIVPLSVAGDDVGIFIVFHHKPNFFSQESFGIVKAIADQTAGIIQNGRSFNETQKLRQDLDQKLIERTLQLQFEQKTNEAMLRILIEVSSSLDLDRALNRTLVLLNDTVGAEQSTIMLLNAEDNLLYFRAGYGYLAEMASGEVVRFKLRIGEGLAGWVVEHREPAIIFDLHDDIRWTQTSSGSLEHRSAIAAPLVVAEDVIGALLVFHRQPNFFKVELLNIIKAVAGQIAVAVNNNHLYELIRDQAERLGAMLRREQEDASRTTAILESISDGVLVTNLSNIVSFINPAAERILGVEPGRLINHRLESFDWLFGRSADSWMQIIQEWSARPEVYESGDIFAEELNLTNGRIISVQLAPVILQNDFLGTVSIFREIR